MLTLHFHVGNPILKQERSGKVHTLVRSKDPFLTALHFFTTMRQNILRAKNTSSYLWDVQLSLTNHLQNELSIRLSLDLFFGAGAYNSTISAVPEKK